MTAAERRSFSRLAKQLAPGELRLDPETRAEHAGDKWFASRTPDAVALPRTTASVSRILRWAHRQRIPVTPRGAGHGYVGGCVPQEGGISLSLARMNRIREIHAGDFIAVVQAGVITSKPRCLKYGVTRDYVLGLEVVLADGSIQALGSRTHKNKTGFDLGRLFVGSEGMLGVVTEATLKLLPLPPFRAALAAGFGKTTDAAQAITGIFSAGFLPCALEVADAFTLEAARKRTGSQRLAGCAAHIITELDGQESSVRSELALLETVLRRHQRTRLLLR